MNAAADFSTRELTCARIQLLDELIFVPQQYAGKTYYHIEVPSKSRFYRVGYREYVFLSLLDGETTFAQAVTTTARKLGRQSLSQQQALEVVTWLLENGIAKFAGAGGGQFSGPNSRSPVAGVLRRLNPFWAKAPLGNPDRLLQILLPFCGWFFSPLMTAFGLLIIAFGAIAVLGQWDRFAEHSRQIFAPHSWLGMGVAWLLLKAVHELAHGLTCKKYRGEVRETGLIFILLAPLAYVDVTSSWRFPSKWKRMHVAAAGIYIELVLAGLAALVWARTDSELVSQLLHNVILMASISTVLFNANPLMRFDGYYLLSDLLEIPNLSSDGARFVRRAGRWLFLGSNTDEPQSLGWRRWCTCGYGLAAAVWRLAVCASLLLAASVMFQGAGVFLAAVGVVSWFAKPVFQVGRTLVRQFNEAPPSFVRAVTVAAALTAAAWGGLVLAPWPGSIAAPAVVDYTDISIVRSCVAGFVDQIHVRDGESIEAGQLLLCLRNDEIESELQDLLHQVEQTRIRHRVARGEHNPAGEQVELQNLAALQQRLAELQSQHQGLQVRAPVAGRVVRRRLEHLLGTYVPKGEELLAVGDEHRKELVVSIAQDDVDAVWARLGESARFRIGARLACRGRLERVEPRGSQSLPHAALGATVGGPLAVTQQDEDPDKLQLIEPRFKAVISIPSETSQQFSCGERGHAILGWTNESIGQHIHRAISRWIERRLASLS